MKHQKLVLCVVALAAVQLLFSSCGYDAGVRKALRMSGENREALESVLTHYKESGDKEAYEVACFLIREMPGHGTYTSDWLCRFQAAVDTMYPEMPNAMRRVFHQIPVTEGNPSDFLLVEDLTNISADYLIRHIDNVMSMYRSCFWLQNYSFEELCDYLFPYRYGHEPMTDSLDATDVRWKKVLAEADFYSMMPAAPDDMRGILFGIIGNDDDAYRYKTPLPFRKETHIFDCEDESAYNISSLRSSGVPCAIEHIPVWPTRNGGHFWWALIDHGSRNGVTSDTVTPRAAKICRQTYTHNPVPKPARGEYIPPYFLDPFRKDVTATYTNVSDVTVKCRWARGRHAYLAVFNGMSWKPVACARMRGRKATFKDMGRGIVYLPVVCHGEDFLAADRPFVLTNEGEIRRLTPTKDGFSICLRRKYPLTYNKTQWARNLTGYRIEADNDTLFSHPVVMAKITTPEPNLNYMTVKIPDTAGAYPCWRIASPKRVNLGELSFQDKSGKPLEGRPLSPTASPKEWQTMFNAFDGDVLTYTNTNKWLGMDFSTPVQVGSVRLISRTDANGIVPGNDYELFYFDRNWVSAGRCTAMADSLVFDGVPAGTLYWLHNHTAGREERIFTYEDGRQVWW